MRVCVCEFGVDRRKHTSNMQYMYVHLFFLVELKLKVINESGTLQNNNTQQQQRKYKKKKNNVKKRHKCTHNKEEEIKMCKMPPFDNKRLVRATHRIIVAL